MATTGNEVVLTSEDLIEYYLDDPDTRIILAFLEGLREPRRFMQLARRALALGKPILALKIGQSAIGSRMARGHTAALAGSARVFEAICRQAGVMLVRDFDEMAAATEIFVHTARPPRGPGTAVIGISGGETGLAADLAEPANLPLPSFAPETVAAVREVMGVPGPVSVLNPFDLGLGRGRLPDRNYQAIVAIGRDPNVDVVAINQDIYPDIDDKLLLYRHSVVDTVVRAASELDKPLVLISPFSAGLQPELVDKLHGAGIAALQGARAGLLAIGHLGRYALRRAQGQPHLYTADPARVGKALRAIAAGQHLLDGQSTRQLLADYGVPVARARLTHSPEEAARAAAELGFPVVLKVESLDLVHKSDVGGVRLGLENREQVADTYSTLLRSVREQRPDAHIEGVLVAEQIAGGVELIVGVQQDAQFGPVVLVGLGGIWAETMDRVALAVPPIDDRSARELLRSFAGSGVLAGVRGQPAADVDAAAEVLVRVGRLALDGEGLFGGLDINPLIVRARGQGCCAVDARVLLPD